MIFICISYLQDIIIVTTDISIVKNPFEINGRFELTVTAARKHYWNPAR